MRWSSPNSEADKNVKFLFPLPFCSTEAMMDWIRLTHTGRAIYFTESTNSNVDLFWKYLHRHIQK
jgi:hypothetical protein